MGGLVLSRWEERVVCLTTANNLDSMRMNLTADDSLRF